MSTALTIAALQRQASLAEVERLRLVAALETERLRADAAGLDAWLETHKDWKRR